MNNPVVITDKLSQPYVAIRRSISQQDIPAALPPLIPAIESWLVSKDYGFDPKPFFRYLDWTRAEMVIEVGFPTLNVLTGEGEIFFGSFPEGRYASVIHHGDLARLCDAHGFLEKWITNEGLEELRPMDESGRPMFCRAEHYLLVRPEVPVDEWRTEVSFLLKTSPQTHYSQNNSG